MIGRGKSAVAIFNGALKSVLLDATLTLMNAPVVGIQFRRSKVSPETRQILRQSVGKIIREDFFL